MSAEIQDVLSVNLVLVGFGLLQAQPELEKFKNLISDDVQTELNVVADIANATAESSRIFTFSRDRLKLNLSNSRSTIVKEFPTDSDLDRLAEVVALAIDCTDLVGKSTQAHGYNIDIVYSQKSGHKTLQYLGERLFNTGFLKESNWGFVGGAVRLHFDDHTFKRTITVEPRFREETSERVFLSLNLHKNESQVPTKDEIKNTLEQIWRESHEFIGRLDEHDK